MDDHTRKGTKHVYTFTSTFPMRRSYSSKTNIQQDFQSLLNMSHCFQTKKIDLSVRMLDLKKSQNGC